MGETVNTGVGHSEKVEKGLMRHHWRLKEGVGHEPRRVVASRSWTAL